MINTRHRVSVAVVLLLALLFYLWTAGTSYPFDFHASDIPESTDAYNLLTTAFLHGHTYLPVKVPLGLLRLHDPYNPAENAAYQQGTYHDLLLYHRHFYSAWGPSATLLFFIARITTYRLPESLAVAIYCYGGLVGAVGLLHVLARRFIPNTPDWLLTVATIGLALTNVAPFLLRRPIQYEVAISGAYFFEMVGLYLTATAVLAPRTRYVRLGWGSLSLGFALLARPTMAAGFLVLLAIVFVLVRRRESMVKVMIATLVPFIVCVVVLITYNEVRFGGAGDFGTQYQLAGLEELHKATEQLSYIPPGMFSYLFIPAQVSLTFPHVFLQTTAELPFHVPDGYAGTPTGGGAEIAGGLLPTMPITILLLALPVVWWRRRAGERRALLIIAGTVAVTLVIMVLLSFALWGTTQRYEMDYASIALIGAFLLWGLLVGRLRRGSWARRAMATSGVVLTALGAAAGAAVSFTGYMNLLLVNHPTIFYDLEDATSPFVSAVTMLTGRPAIVRVAGLTHVNPPSGSPYTTFDQAGSTTYIGGAPLTVTIVSPRSERTALTAIALPASVALAGQFVHVTSPGQKPNTVPVLGSSLRLPIRLHWGLNRVVIRSARATAAQPSQILLTDLRLEP